MVKLNPNCSETVWKLTGIKQPKQGRTEHSWDTSGWDAEFWMDELIGMIDKNNISKVGIKLVEDSGGSLDEQQLKYFLTLTKSVMLGKMSKEDALKKFNAANGVDD